MIHTKKESHPWPGTMRELASWSNGGLRFAGPAFNRTHLTQMQTLCKCFAIAA